MSPLFTEVLLWILTCHLLTSPSSAFSNLCEMRLALVAVIAGAPFITSIHFKHYSVLFTSSCLSKYRSCKFQVTVICFGTWGILGDSPAHISHLHVFVNKIHTHTQLQVNIPIHRQCLYTYLHTHKHQRTSWPWTLHLNWELLPPFPFWEALAFRSDFVSNREAAVGNPWTMSLNRRMRVMFIGIKINFKFLRGVNQIQCFPVSWHFLYWCCLGSSGEGRGKKFSKSALSFSSGIWGAVLARLSDNPGFNVFTLVRTVASQILWKSEQWRVLFRGKQSAVV